MKFIAASALALFLSVHVFAQNPPPLQPPVTQPPPTAAISGVVVDGSTDAPIENASVTIQGASANRMFQTRQFTDAKGRFVFVNVPPSLDYTLSANVPGYFGGTVTRESGPTTQNTTIQAKPDEWVRDVRISVWKPGSISGRVLDETGEPLVGLYVRTIARVPIAGREQLIAGPLAISDDRGEYRIAGLNAGRYFVQIPSVQARPSAPPSAPPPTPGYSGISGRFPWPPAPGPDGAPRAYPITFYPGTRFISDAIQVEVALAEERRGVDIALSPVPVFAVSGTIQGPAEGLSLRLIPSGLESLGIGSEAAAAPIATDGAFTFSGVPVGSYLIDIRRRVPEFSTDLRLSFGRLPNSSPATSMSMSSTQIQAAPPGMSLAETKYGPDQNASSSHARVPISVANADVAGVVVVLKNSGAMDGIIEVDVNPATPNAKPAPFQLGFSLDPASGDPELGAPTAQVGGGFGGRGGGPGQAAVPDNSFRFDGLRGGAYFLRNRGKDWIIKSISWNGEDYTHRPFDSSATSSFTGVKVTMTNRVSSISGTVKETGAAVILFPANRDHWSNFGFNPPLIRSVYTAPDGSYRIDGLPGGDYLVVAVPANNRMAWLEPGFFGRAASLASRVTLDWGETESVSLSVVTVPR